MNIRRLLALTAAVVALVAGGMQLVRADISSVSPAMTLIPPPASVTLGSLESSTEIFVFEEQQGVTLGSSLTVDFTSPGEYKKAADLAPASLSPGLTVCSHLIHFDPDGSALATASGSVTFSNDVLGVITSTANLGASDPSVGTVTTYPTTLADRGLELASNLDQISLSADKRTIQVSVKASTALDHARVLTTCPAPEPPSEWVYTVKYTCGAARGLVIDALTLAPGMYATDINISNPSEAEAELRKRVTPLVWDGRPAIREPEFTHEVAVDAMVLPQGTATMDDCLRIADLLYQPFPFPTLDALPLTVGFLEIRSPVELDVVAVYTAAVDPGTGSPPGVPSIDVEQIEGRRTS